MFTVTVAGKSSAMNMRFGNAREAVEAYRKMQDEGSGNLTVTDNRVHKTIELSELEEQARAEEPDAGPTKAYDEDRRDGEREDRHDAVPVEPICRSENGTGI